MSHFLLKLRQLQIFSVLHVFIYSLVASLVLSIYSLRLALINKDDFVFYLSMLMLLFFLVFLGEVVLHKLTLRAFKYGMNNIVISLPCSLFLQTLLLAALIALRRNEHMRPVVYNELYVMFILLVGIVLSNVVSILILKRSGLNMRTDRYVKLASGLLIGILIVTGSAIMYSGGSSSDEKSIILVSVDSWRYDHADFIDGDVITPNVNRLFQNGITFDNFHVHAPYTWTSLSSIMTSLESPIHLVRKNGQFLDDRFLTLAEVMRDNGYKCFVSSDINVHLMGLDQGFEVFSRLKNLTLLGFYGIHLVMSKFVPEFFGRLCFARNDSMPTTIRTLEFLRQNRSKKFFLWIHYYNEPHSPYFAPRYYVNKYNKGKSSWMTGDLPRALQGKPSHKHLVEGKTITDKDLEYFRNLYRAEVTAMDTQLGMILDNLKNHGLLEKVMFVLTSDHGEDFGERGHFGHSNNLYYGLIHVPLIMKLPGQNGKKRTSGMARGIDIAPTILQYAGIETPHHFHGSNLLEPPGSDNKGKSKEWWCFSETLKYGFEWPYENYAFSYTSRKYKYLSLPLEEHEELYDLESDPRETNNIAGNNQEAISNIHNQLRAYFHLKDIRDLVPTGEAVIDEERLKMLKALGYI